MYMLPITIPIENCAMKNGKTEDKLFRLYPNISPKYILATEIVIVIRINITGEDFLLI